MTIHVELPQYERIVIRDTLQSILRRSRHWILMLASLVACGASLAVACGLDVVGNSAGNSALDLPDTSSLVDARSNDADVVDPADETCPWASVQRNSPWPMLGGCVRRAGRTALRGPSNPTQRRRIEAPSLSASPAVGADGTLYVPAGVSGIVAVRPDGGWRAFTDFNSDDSVTSPPVIGTDGTLYFGAGLRFVAQSAAGTNWSFDTKEENLAAAAIDLDGTLYFGSLDSKLYAVYPDGGERWSKDLGDDVVTAAAIGPTERIYVAVEETLFALDKNGSEVWTFPLEGKAITSPVIADDGTVYVGTDDKQLLAIDPNGERRWVSSLNADFVPSQLPAIARDGTIYAMTESTLKAIIPENGGLRWERDLAATFHTSVIVDRDDNLYVAGDKVVVSLDPDGEERWRRDIDAKALGFTIGLGGTLYVTCDDDSLIALQD